MIKTAYYTYLGTNGTITSPIHLEGVYYTIHYRLVADKDCVLTDGVRQVKSITVTEEEVLQWTEIKGQD